jgi:hypothetical protein
MIPRLRVLVPFFCCAACEQHSQPQQTASVASSTTAQVTADYSLPPEPLEPRYRVAAPDSSFGSWSWSGSFYSADHVRHPSGLLTIWLDTAVRAGEDRPVGRAHADSIVVSGLRHGEWLGRICMIGKSLADTVAGLVPDTTVFVRPRLAWSFDTNFRIKPIPTDSVTCIMNAPPEEGD